MKEVDRPTDPLLNMIVSDILILMGIKGCLRILINNETTEIDCIDAL